MTHTGNEWIIHTSNLSSRRSCFHLLEDILCSKHEWNVYGTISAWKYVWIPLATINSECGIVLNDVKFASRVWADGHTASSCVFSRETSYSLVSCSAAGDNTVKQAATVMIRSWTTSRLTSRWRGRPALSGRFVVGQLTRTEYMQMRYCDFHSVWYLGPYYIDTWCCFKANYAILQS
jgi:hypothetical protein